MAEHDRPLADAPWIVAAESRTLMAMLAETDHEARFVGGCVRDGLLDPKLDVTDVDIATQEPAEELMRRLRGGPASVLPTGLAHGTITVRLGRRSFEVTTLRSDVATDGRHATVAMHRDFALDAARRDLTINAMSCDQHGQVYDYAGGMADLAAGRVRFVGEPRQRIREDYLRILRFFRFHARYGRDPADVEALAACRIESPGIDRLSGERIQTELFKLLMAPGVLTCLRLMDEIGVLARAVPAALAIDGLADLLHTHTDADVVLRLAALLRAAAADRAAIERVAVRLVLARRDADRLTDLVLQPFPDPVAAARSAYLLGPPLWRDLSALAMAGREPAELRAKYDEMGACAWETPSLPVTGADLLARSVPQGPELGRLLADLRTWWLDGGFAADRAACLAELDRRLAARH